MAGEYESDARYKRLLTLIALAEKSFRSPYTHKLSKEDERTIEQARRDLRSIGLQLDRAYQDQLPLIPDVPPRKAIQQR